MKSLDHGVWLIKESGVLASLPEQLQLLGFEFCEHAFGLACLSDSLPQSVDELLLSLVGQQADGCFVSREHPRVSDQQLLQLRVLFLQESYVLLEVS